MRPAAIVAATALVLSLPTNAHAYIDPGSGMLLWQGLLAAMGTVLVFYRALGRALRRLFNRLLRK